VNDDRSNPLILSCKTVLWALTKSGCLIRSNCEITKNMTRCDSQGQSRCGNGNLKHDSAMVAGDLDWIGEWIRQCAMKNKSNRVWLGH
jgi:hypothetical protein